MLRRRPTPNNLSLGPTVVEEEYFQKQDQHLIAKLKEKKAGAKPTHVRCTWDYKNGEEARNQLLENLPKIGIHVYRDPECDGQDAFGIIVSTVPLTDDQVIHISRAASY